MGFSKLWSGGRKVKYVVNYSRMIATSAARRGEGEGGCVEGKADPPAGGGGEGGGKSSVVVGVYSAGAGGAGAGSFELTPAARALDQRSGGAVCRVLNEMSCSLRAGGAVVVTEPEGAGGPAAAAVALLGDKDAGFNQLEDLDEKRENVRCGVGAGVALLVGRGARRVRVDPCGAPDAAAEGAALAAWRFQEFKSCEERVPETEVSLLAEGEGEAGGDAASWREGAVRARAQNWARFLSDMPANRMTPTDLAQAALDVLCPLGVRVEAHDAAWIRAQGLEAFQAAARGSCEPAVLLECVYDGPTAAPPVLLAAKGVTFDSGGLCLKAPPQMAENRGSMAGAAVALAAVRVVAELKVPMKLRCVIPLCENMISGQCMKVGDVVRALNGLSIQIENTDMEGRLMLADALVYGQALYKPALVIDVATLTHGILLATGGGAFGCFSNSEGVWGATRAAGATTGDRPWRFPLWHYYQRQITNEAAVDLRNMGSGKATPCLGAAFLRNFVCGEWLHMDITGVGKLGHAPAPPYLDARRMTGRPARTLAALLQTLAKQDACKDKP